MSLCLIQAPYIFNFPANFQYILFHPFIPGEHIYLQTVKLSELLQKLQNLPQSSNYRNPTRIQKIQNSISRLPKSLASLLQDERKRHPGEGQQFRRRRRLLHQLVGPGGEEETQRAQEETPQWVQEKATPNHL